MKNSYNLINLTFAANKVEFTAIHTVDKELT